MYAKMINEGQIERAPKITVELRKTGEVISERTVGTYMRQMGIRAGRRLLARQCFKAFGNASRRIGSRLYRSFLYFLEKNGLLYEEGQPIIDNATLAAITVSI